MLDTEELVSTLMKVRYLFKSMNAEPPTVCLVSPRTLKSLRWELENSDTLVQYTEITSLVIAGIEFRAEERK